jgi:predicted nucleic acid-binding protein
MSAERSRQFLDTNVLVYAYDSSAGDKHNRAVELVEQLAGDDAGALSVQVLQEFFVTVTAKVARPLSARDAAAAVADLIVMPTHAPAGADVLGAIDIHTRLGVSFWDAMVIRSASQLSCGVLWSEDLTSGRSYEGVEVRTPFA